MVKSGLPPFLPRRAVEVAEREEAVAVLEADLLLRGHELEGLSDVRLRDDPRFGDAVHVAVGEVVDRASGLLEKRPEQHREEGEDQHDEQALARHLAESKELAADVSERDQTGHEQHEAGGFADFLGDDAEHPPAPLELCLKAAMVCSESSTTGAPSFSGEKLETNSAKTGTMSSAPT